MRTEAMRAVLSVVAICLAWPASAFTSCAELSKGPPEGWCLPAGSAWKDNMTFAAGIPSSPALCAQNVTLTNGEQVTVSWQERGPTCHGFKQ